VLDPPQSRQVGMQQPKSIDDDSGAGAALRLLMHIQNDYHIGKFAACHRRLEVGSWPGSGIGRWREKRSRFSSLN
jgi:hypothetical protein